VLMVGIEMHGCSLTLTLTPHPHPRPHPHPHQVEMELHGVDLQRHTVHALRDLLDGWYSADPHLDPNPPRPPRWLVLR